MAMLGEEKKQQQTDATAVTQDTSGSSQQTQQRETTPKQTVTPQQTAAQNTQPAVQQTTAPQQTVTPTAAQTTSGARSAAYDRAMATLKKAENNAPSYSSSYDDEINEIYNKITNRQPFKYDYSTDPLYGQYKEQYTQLGKQAMRDSMGQTAALTGGYGNSYGSAVGQQQYDAYLQRLNDVLPELYGQAYNLYAAEGDALKERYTLAADQRNTEYNQFRDALSDFRYDQALDLEKARQLAEDLGAYGDFSGYGELYGEDAAARMAKTWAAANPIPAYINGQITADEYYQITGEYPYGYTPPGAAVSSGGGGGGGVGQGGWDPGNHTQYSKDLQALIAANRAAGKYTY